MRQRTFVKLSFLLFGLVFASFLVLGFSRIVLPYRTARLLAAPTMAAAALLAVGLLARTALAALGVSKFE